MITPVYPEPDFRFREVDGRRQIFDQCRRRWVVLTPEEWVRQNTIRWMVMSLGYPSSLIAVERELSLGELRKRFDIVIHDRKHQPWMMVECKAPAVSLGESVLMQLLRYNLSIPVTYLMVTNGEECHVAQRDGMDLKWLSELPKFPF